MKTLLILYLILEATNQTSRLGWIKVWRIERVPIVGGSGFTPHPWACFSTVGSEPHELEHVVWLARWTLIGKAVLYFTNGLGLIPYFRYRCEVTCDVAGIPVNILRRSDNDPELELKIFRIAGSNRGSLYFNVWYLPIGSPPPIKKGLDYTWRAVIARRRRLE